MLIVRFDDAHIVTDLQGVVVSYNDAAELLLGYRSTEIVGRPIKNLIPPERHGEEDAFLARVRSGGPVGYFETLRITKGGRLLDVGVTPAAVHDHAGNIVGVLRALRDITKERQAMAAQAHLAAIVASSDDAIISKDLDGIIRSCNASAERLFGYSAAELVGRPVRILIPQERQEEEDVILAKLRRGERIDHFETVRIARNGNRLDISLTVSPVRDASGAIIGVSKVARDITERKRAQAALAAQQEWFRVTLGSIGDAVIASDAAGGVTYMNAQAESLTGWTLDAAITQTLQEVFHILHEHTRERVENPAGVVMRTGHVVGLANHTVLVSRDGVERPISDSAAPIRDAEGRMLGVVLVFRDVGEQRRVETERHAAAIERERILQAERAARAEAERASRVKDEFVAMVSHELRTPLNAILGWTQLMTNARHDPVMVERGLDVVARNTRLQAQLISDLLDISRIVAGKLQLEVQQRIDLAGIVTDAIETVQHEAAPKGIRIHPSLDVGLGPVAGDPGRLQQAVWNLLSNAIKFSPSGGQIDVTLRRLGDRAEIVVSDTGVGIKADVLPYIFDRFHQADRSITRRFGGLGLGLSIVKHLVQLHGGQVAAESAGEGRGARFTIQLPLAIPCSGKATGEATASDGAPAPVTTDASTLRGIRVLVVEDEPDTREFLVRLLEAHGATVESVASAAEALKAFAAAPPHVVVSDIGLPDVDGYELMRRIRLMAPSSAAPTPAIALTAYARTEDRTRALGAGYDAHVVKPVESAELVSTISRLTTTLRAQRSG